MSQVRLQRIISRVLGVAARLRLAARSQPHLPPTGQSGFTLIETVIAVVVLSLMITAIGNLFAFNLGEVAVGKAKAVGLALANEKMEYLRDLPYDSLATQNGNIYPPGNIQDDQTVIRGNYNFRVHTHISYVDDPYDGNAAGTIVGKPTDIYPYDYKLAEIIVYMGGTNTIVAQLDTGISAKAAETSSNTGIIRVSVINASGNPVPNATVHIYNPNPNPAVDIYTSSDNQGNVEIPKLPPDSNNNYQVTASLAGYSTDGTLAGQYATKENLNVIAQQISSVTLAIDQVAQLAIHAVDTSGNPLSGLTITATGLKTSYNAHTPTAAVPKNTYSGTTDASGNLTLANAEWDGYGFSVPGSHYIVSASPMQPVALQPNATLSVTLVVSTNSSWPTIAAISPVTTSQDSSATITITGSNFAAGTTVALHQNGQTDIPASSVTIADPNDLTATFDLSAAPTGAWDVIVANGTSSATQSGGLSVN